MINGTPVIRHIVLAEDDEDERLFFTEALEESNLNVTFDSVRDGHDLMLYLRNFGAQVPDMIFLDMNMPKKTGMECLVEIRADERLRNVPVAIYSTSSHPPEVEEAYVKGANVYICKTPDFKNLTTIIARVLDRINDFTNSKLGKEDFLIVR